AGGEPAKARAELIRIIELRPDDMNLRLQIAQQLVQEGQAASAIEHYKAVLKQDPALLGRQFYQVQNAFQQARKTDEFLGLLEQMDLRQLGYSNYVFNAIGNLSQDDTMRGRVLPLVRKAWEAFPDERSNMLAYLRRDEFWQMPEIYEYAHEIMIPKASAYIPAMQWTALGQVLSYGPDGRMNSMVSRLLDLAASQGRLDELAAEVDAAGKTLPGWSAGTALRA